MTTLAIKELQEKIARLREVDGKLNALFEEAVVDGVKSLANIKSVEDPQGEIERLNAEMKSLREDISKLQAVERAEAERAETKTYLDGLEKPVNRPQHEHRRPHPRNPPRSPSPSSPWGACTPSPRSGRPSGPSGPQPRTPGSRSTSTWPSSSCSTAAGSRRRPRLDIGHNLMYSWPSCVSEPSPRTWG